MSSNSITPVQQMLSSCTGAILTSVFVTPLDVVKVRLQAQQKQIVKNKCYVYCNALVEDLCCCVNSSFTYHRPSHLTSIHFAGTTDAFFKIARSEGVLTLWSGLPATLVMALPATVAYFTVYDQMLHHLNTKLSTSSSSSYMLIGPVIAGASARVVSASFVSPIEMVRTTMQSKKLSYLEIGNAVRTLVLAKGVKSMWRGLVPTLWRDVPFSVIYWSSYEGLKRKFNQQQPTVWFSLMAGATSGMVAAFFTTPFDVLKTLRQIELSENPVTRGIPHSMYQQMNQLYRKQGIKSLFTGLAPRIVKTAPACAIMISTYEFSKSFFRQNNSKREL